MGSGPLRTDWLTVDTADDTPALVLVGDDTPKGSTLRRPLGPWVRHCIDETELPKRMLPLSSPGGSPQSLRRARNRALLGCGVLGTALLVMYGMAFGFPFGLLGSNGIGRDISGLSILGPAVALNVKVWPEFRIL